MARAGVRACANVRVCVRAGVRVRVQHNLKRGDFLLSIADFDMGVAAKDYIATVRPLRTRGVQTCALSRIERTVLRN